MKRLLRMYKLETKEQYFDIINKADEMEVRNYRFRLMTKKDKILCIKYNLAHNQPQNIICQLLDMI